MKNRQLLDALECRNKGRPPVWMMRQAGRYMPQYRAIRSKHSFLEMCHTPELAAEVTLLPIKLLDVDAAILFSDILVLPEAMGVGLRFEENVGPIIERPITSTADIEALPRHDLSPSLAYVGEAIKLVRKDLKVPLIGFCGAPFTVASYMIEGGSSRDLKKTKQWLMRDPESFHILLDLIADHAIAYLKMQVEAGAEALQIFDSWAQHLNHPHFREFSLAYMKKIHDALAPSKVPMILFCRGSSVFARELASLKPAGISIDWNAEMSEVRKQVPASVCLQGNLDPDYLYAPPAMLQKEVRRIMRSMTKDQGYIFNLGHGISPDVPIDSVRLLVETVKASG